MQYYEQLRTETREALTQEYNDVKKQFSDNQNDEVRARYTLLLSLPNTSFHNTATALHLLNEWPKKSELSTDTTNFRNLLILLLNEQQALSSKIRNLSQKLDVETKRSRALQQQVEDIKDMEKSLFRRNTN